MNPNQEVVRRRPVIRVFVSSTFADLKHERDALQQVVYPKLERLCASRGFQFQAIDLRWGVPTEASLDHRTMRICFEELRRSQLISPEPNFLILLGNRYGWRPLPEEISKDEYEILERAAVQISAKDTLLQWYLEDKNALPRPVYILQPRTEDYTSDPVWNEVQIALWRVINLAFPADQLAGRFEYPMTLDSPLPSIVRFQTSATEQEIWRGAFAVPNAGEHVLAFVREIDNGAEFSQENQVFVDADQKPLQELKATLTKHLGEKNVIAFEQVRLHRSTNEKGAPIVDVTTEHLTEMCNRVYNALETIIEPQIKAYWGGAPSNASRIAREREIENDEHRRFGLERAPEASFVGRDEERPDRGFVVLGGIVVVVDRAGVEIQASS